MKNKSCLPFKISIAKKLWIAEGIKKNIVEKLIFSNISGVNLLVDEFIVKRKEVTNSLFFIKKALDFKKLKKAIK